MRAARADGPARRPRLLHARRGSSTRAVSRSTGAPGRARRRSCGSRSAPTAARLGGRAARAAARRLRLAWLDVRLGRRAGRARALLPRDRRDGRGAAGRAAVELRRHGQQRRPARPRRCRLSEPYRSAPPSGVKTARRVTDASSSGSEKDISTPGRLGATLAMWTGNARDVRGDAVRHHRAADLLDHARARLHRRAARPARGDSSTGSTRGSTARDVASPHRNALLGLDRRVTLLEERL